MNFSFLRFPEIAAKCLASRHVRRPFSLMATFSRSVLVSTVAAFKLPLGPAFIGMLLAVPGANDLCARLASEHIRRKTDRGGARL